MTDEDREDITQARDQDRKEKARQKIFMDKSNAWPTMSRKETPSCWKEDDDPEIGLPVTYKSGTGVAYHQQRQKKLDKAKHGQSVRILACREPSTGRDGASHRPGIG